MKKQSRKRKNQKQRRELAAVFASCFWQRYSWNPWQHLTRDI